jgi:hypothetical protein
MGGRGGAWLLGALAVAACSAPPSTTPAVPGPATPAAPTASGTPAVPGRATPAAPTAAGCAADVAPAPLPGWARSGFSPPDQAVPFVVGERGTILGVLFGQPFSAPPAPDRGNKILWVTRDPHPAGPLTITAALDGTTAVATRQVPDGPGPSLVDLPAPGCWHLTLAWPGHTDRVTVAYR